MVANTKGSPAGLTFYQTGRRQATDECLVPSPAYGRYKLAGRQADFLLTFAKAKTCRTRDKPLARILPLII
jgi:hypothetical protein